MPEDCSPVHRNNQRTPQILLLSEVTLPVPCPAGPPGHRDRPGSLLFCRRLTTMQDPSLTPLHRGDVTQQQSPASGITSMTWGWCMHALRSVRSCSPTAERPPNALTSKLNFRRFRSVGSRAIEVNCEQKVGGYGRIPFPIFSVLED